MRKHPETRTFKGVQFELISILNVDKVELLQRIKNLKKDGTITKARIITIPVTEAEYPKLYKWGHKFNYLLYAVCVPREFPETRTMKDLKQIALSGLEDMGLSKEDSEQLLRLLANAKPTYAQVQEFYDELEQEKPFDGGMSFEQSVVAMKESLLEK